jgi:hypothetical protein
MLSYTMIVICVMSLRDHGHMVIYMCILPSGLVALRAD